MPSVETISSVALIDEQARHLATQRIFFGHQSVGDNIVQGIRELMARDPRVYLNIINDADPGRIGPAFVERHVGENANPRSKNEAFRVIVENGLGTQNAIAMLKYCYVDIGFDTDVREVFDAYANLISKLNKKDPTLKIVHITVPLTTVESASRAWLKGVLGKPTARQENIKRNQFNQLLRGAYQSDSIFDLAEVECTSPDGSHSCFMDSDAKTYTLSSEYTNDGGHLNHAGRRAAAQRLLMTLANM